MRPTTPDTGTERADIVELAAEHLQRAKADAHGRSAHLLLHDGPLRQTLIALRTGTTLADHEAPLAGTLFVLRGSITLTTADGDLPLDANQFAPIPHERHGLTALSDAAVILTAVTRT
ncbi:MAG: cupin [Hamadaea sp.]|nr:cupin [Hamadaea sp.]